MEASQFRVCGRLLQLIPTRPPTMCGCGFQSLKALTVTWICH